MKNYEANAEKFITAYREIQAADPYQITRVQRSRGNYIEVPTETIGNVQVPQYISHSRLNRYISNKNTFHSRTAPMNSRIKSLILAAFSMACSWATPAQEVTLIVPKQESTSLLGWADLSADYSLRTDLNSTKDPRTYQQALDLSISHAFDKYLVFLSAGVDYTTVGSTVYRSNSNQSYYTMRDWSVGVNRKFTLSANNSLSAFLTEDILFSEESRYFGYRSVTGQDQSFDEVGQMVQRPSNFSGSYILNTFRFAPVSSGTIRVGDINPDALATYGVGPVFTLLPGLSLSAQLVVRSTHYLDNTSTYGFATRTRWFRRRPLVGLGEVFKSRICGSR